MVKVSVIIPVYNTEKYLRKCLDSVCNQTLKDIEIICVNDCSPDNCLDILREYAENDDRIKIIDFAENKGAAAARNAGIEQAQGEYLGFVDSDDFIDLDFYEKLYNKAAETGADVAKGNYKSAADGSVDYSLNEKVKEDKNNFAFAYCSAIFKRSVIINNNILFPYLSDMEDPVFTFNFALSANKAEIIDNAFINIVAHDDSATGGIPDLIHIMDKLAGLDMLVKLANSAKITHECYNFVLSFWFWATIVNSVKNKQPEIRETMAKTLFKSFEKIKNKQSFCSALYNISPFLARIMETKNIDGIINLNLSELAKKDLVVSLRKRVAGA